MIGTKLWRCILWAYLALYAFQPRNPFANSVLALAVNLPSGQSSQIISELT